MYEYVHNGVVCLVLTLAKLKMRNLPHLLVDPCRRSTTFYVEFENDLSRAEPAARGLARCLIMSDQQVRELLTGVRSLVGILCRMLRVSLPVCYSLGRTL
jgi:hypothetical protein